MKKIFSLAFTLLTSWSAAVAQGAAPATASSIWDDPALLFYVTVGFLFVVVIMVLFVAVYMLQVLNLMAKQAAQERAQKLGIEYKEEPGFWAKINQSLTDAVPVDKEVTVMLDHNYDGIRELDNHLPPWWKWLFYGTIAFAAVYLVVYHVTGTMPLAIGEYENEVAYAQQQMLKLQAANPGPAIDENNVEVTADAKALNDGKGTFTSICASCHRVDGGGDIGPNLTDPYWKHGGSIKEIFKVVKNGVPATNMVAWGGSLSPEKIRNVASYVLTLQGSNPANGKKPEGNLYKPEPAPVAKDSAKAAGTL